MLCSLSLLLSCIVFFSVYSSLSILHQIVYINVFSNFYIQKHIQHTDNLFTWKWQSVKLYGYNRNIHDCVFFLLSYAIHLETEWVKATKSICKCVLFFINRILLPYSIQHDAYLHRIIWNRINSTIFHSHCFFVSLSFC